MEKQNLLQKVKNKLKGETLIGTVMVGNYKDEIYKDEIYKDEIWKDDKRKDDKRKDDKMCAYRHHLTNKEGQTADAITKFRRGWESSWDDVCYTSMHDETYVLEFSLKLAGNLETDICRVSSRFSSSKSNLYKQLEDKCKGNDAPDYKIATIVAQAGYLYHKEKEDKLAKEQIKEEKQREQTKQDKQQRLINMANKFLSR